MNNDHLYPPGLAGPSRSPTPSLSHERNPSTTSENGYEAERFLARTPSPTPSENELIRRKGAGFDIDRENFKKYFTRQYISAHVSPLHLRISTNSAVQYDGSLLSSSSS